MTCRVRIIRNWTYPDLMRQTPASAGIWSGFEFTELPEPCDYVIVLNTPGLESVVDCPPENLWAIMQEPPNEIFAWMHRGQKEYSRIYTTDHTLKGERYIHSQPALPWHVNKDYDFLAYCPPPEKKRVLSWITSNKAVFKGHKKRMGFLERIRKKMDFDLFGHGFTFLDDKWDGLAPYCYSLAIENYNNPYYWSEKIADCFLAWTMPVYYGCTHITEYFPAEAMIQIDINDPDTPKQIADAIYSDRYKKNLDAIAEARKLILEKYQLFPMLAQQIATDLQSPASSTKYARTISIKPASSPHRKVSLARKVLSRMLKG
jgi:hypothetical protein